MKAHFNSPYGRISSEWKVSSPTQLALACAVPSNTKAVVHFPLTTLQHATIRENGMPIWCDGAFVAGAPGISYDGADGQSARFKVGAGSYVFSATGTAMPKLGK